VTHIYNPSYSGCRDQDDYSLKPTQANKSVKPYLKKTHHKKRVSGVAQGAGPELKSPVPQKANRDKP
jgi:hypothetical protein